MKKSFPLVLVLALIQLVLASPSFADPIHDAVEAGNLAEVLRLIDLDRAVVNSHEEYWGFTPLHFAANSGHTVTVQALLASGADVNAGNQTGVTPLSFATVNRHAATIAARS